MDTGKLEEMLHWILEALDRQDFVVIQGKVQQLKQADGESWAIGELTERVMSAWETIASDGEALRDYFSAID